MNKIISGLAYQTANTSTKVISPDIKPFINSNEIKKTLKIGSSFSGIGALEMAASNIGLLHSSEYIIEWDKYAQATYLANFKVKKIFNNITKIDINEVPDVDLYVSSPPCVDFSSNGLQKGFKGTSGTLVFDALNIIKKAKVKPSYLIYENVKYWTFAPNFNGKTDLKYLLCVTTEYDGYRYWQI